MLQDRFGNAVSASQSAIVERLDDAVEMLLGFRGEALPTVEKLLEEQPDFAMGHAFHAGLMVMSMEGACVAPAEEILRKAGGLKRINAREAAHFAAVEAWCGGDILLARHRYGEIVARHPRDLFALQVAHALDFFVGDSCALRDRPTRALQGWRAAEHGYSWLRGMEAFGLEETGDYAAAEDAGRMALALQPSDAWAAHAVAHVMEMQGRDAEGVAFLSQREADWIPADLLAVHNWWHRALFHLERGAFDQVLSIYDRSVAAGVAAGTPQPAIEMVDCSAMLWRLWLRGADTGSRFALLSDAWLEWAGEGYYAFNDLHALMAHLGAGRAEAVDRVLAAMEAATREKTTNARMTREVGLPMATALRRFAEGAYAEAGAMMAPLLPGIIRCGGSHAQRDVFSLTLLEAALRARDWSLAQVLATQRVAAKPMSPVARALMARAGALPRAA